MGAHGASTTERILLEVFAPLCVLSGAVLVSGFFFPEMIGEVVSGQVWLVLALVFFGSGLGYIALLPLEGVEPAEVPDEFEGYVLQLRRMGLARTIQGFLRRQEPVTFFVTIGAMVVFFVVHTIFPANTLDVIGVVQALLLEDVGWLFIGPMLLSVIFCLYLLVGPWGEIKLGGETAEPSYTYPVYFTMFFTAGIAAGIVFWGPAEALFHYDSPPPFVAAEGHSEAAITGALMYSLFHWGFSAWSAYLVLGIPIAYYVYERGAPLRVSSILTPVFGVDELDNLTCKVVDILAIFATIGGIATSVALVSQQFLTGIDFQWDVTVGTLGPIFFVTGLTVIFVLSAQSGIHRGIRRIADVNIVLFVVLGALLLFLGPTRFILSEGASATGAYGLNFVPLSIEFGDQFVAGWTVWNWIWWFSWAPFAGLFLAALSRGRRLRSVVLTGFVATSLATMVWFLIIGGAAVHHQHTGEVDILAAMAQNGGSEAVSGFPLLDALPLADLLIFLFLALIIVFMATSADTSTLVVAVLSTRHRVAPTTGAIVFWGVIQGLVAVLVLVMDAGEALQRAAVLLGGPIAILAIVALVGLVVTFLRHERGHRWLGRIVFDRVRQTGEEEADR